MAFFSIIVPVYNGEAYLETCVNSVLQQRENDWELILVDDGSPDASPSLCDRLARQDSRISVIHKENEGVASARKTGCDRAIGAYIAFLDCDDWLDSAFLSDMRKTVEETGADLICSGLVQENRDGSKVEEKTLYSGLLEKEDIRRRIYPILLQGKKAEYYPPSLCGCVFRHEIIRPYMIADSRARIGEDGACVIPAVFHSGRIAFLEKCYYHYRYNDSSATKSHRVFLWDNPEVVADHIGKHVDMNQGDFRQQMDRKLVHDVFNVCATQFYRSEDLKEIKRDIRTQLERPRYAEAIHRARFDVGSSGWIARLALRYRLLWLIRAYANRK